MVAEKSPATLPAPRLTTTGFTPGAICLRGSGEGGGSSAERAASAPRREPAAGAGSGRERPPVQFGGRRARVVRCAPPLGAEGFVHAKVDGEARPHAEQSCPHPPIEPCGGVGGGGRAAQRRQSLGGLSCAAREARLGRAPRIPSVLTILPTVPHTPE